MNKLKFEKMPPACRSTVYMKDGFWQVRDPEQKQPRYLMAEMLTLGWVVMANVRIKKRETA